MKTIPNPQRAHPRSSQTPKPAAQWGSRPGCHRGRLARKGRTCFPSEPAGRDACATGRVVILLLSLLLAFIAPAGARGAEAAVKGLTIDGGLEGGRARLVIEALLNGLGGSKEKPLHATTLHHTVELSGLAMHHSVAATFDVLNGAPEEFVLVVDGPGDILKVTGEGVLDWSVRQTGDGRRELVIRPTSGSAPLKQLKASISARRIATRLTEPSALLTFTPPEPALLNGYLRIHAPAEWTAKLDSASGLVPVDPALLPEAMRNLKDAPDGAPLAFRFSGAAYSARLNVTPADPDEQRVVLRDFALTGELAGGTAAFTLSATAHVKNSTGAKLRLLSGAVALTDAGGSDAVRLEGGYYTLAFDRAGAFPVRLKFHAMVERTNGWSAVGFNVAPAAMQRLVLRGLAADTRFRFDDAARPERARDDFISYLPANGLVKLAWQEARQEAEGKLFFAAEMLSQIRVAPGLMRQEAALNFKVMQGEMGEVTLRVAGSGAIARVDGDQVLAWRIEPVPGSDDRRLTVRLNQPQRDAFSLLVQAQTPLGAFPQVAEALRIHPEGATRFSGHFRIVNDGAVRIEVGEARGLSQVSPEQFPQTGATKAFHPGGGQRFAYRFSGADFALKLQADQILPELSVSQVLAYHLGDSDLAVDAEIELDIREAPLRELLVRVPRGYSLAQVSSAGLADYFLRAADGEPDAELRLVFTQPVSGRHIVLLRLERNTAPDAASWELPPIRVMHARSVRGNVGVAAAAGFRLSPVRTEGLGEIATAFFPRKAAGLQAAFRISEPDWAATLGIERLPQTVQADAFHLFSIGEGIAYGSSVINYVVTGAPVSAFHVGLSEEYFNVEFTGPELRNWEKTTNGWLVRLHAPVSGPYTLLAAYERPFKPQGETLAFTGARPLDTQTEQGHTLVISTHQFSVKPVDVSPGLLPLETAEVPPEYRLFFDAPILAAYRYTSRPFNLSLALTPLAQGESLNQIVDRAVLLTRISKEGQVITDATYYVKSRGNPHLRLAMPDDSQLWSVTVNGAATAPVTDSTGHLIRLPQQADPNALLQVQLKIASRSERPERVRVAMPLIQAPVMLAEWKLQPDEGRRLEFRAGTLAPDGGVPDTSGFAQLVRVLRGSNAAVAALLLASTGLLLLIGLGAWRWAGADGVHRGSGRHLAGGSAGLLAIVVAAGALLGLAGLLNKLQEPMPGGVAFLAPVQQAGSALEVEVSNLDVTARPGVFALGWPVALALLAWAFGWVREQRMFVPLGWTLLAWAALRAPGGGPVFVGVIGAFLAVHGALPALRRLWRVPPRPSDAGGDGPVPAMVALLIMGVLLPGFPAVAADAPALHVVSRPVENSPTEPPFAGGVSQTIRVEDGQAFATATVRWSAVRGQSLPLVSDPAVVTRVTHPPGKLKLVRTTEPRTAAEPSAGGSNSVGIRMASHGTHHLLALEDGTYDIGLEYQVAVTARGEESGITLPTQFGLVNDLRLTLAGLDVDVVSPAAVSVERGARGTNTVASLVLKPVNGAWIGWKPRSRDVAGERTIFYAEWSQLYAPSAGVIEGVHHVVVRPAQGAVGELTFSVPAGATVTDVTTPATRTQAATRARTAAPAAISAPLVTLWRFDPDTRRLRVTLRQGQAGPFALVIHSQVATGPLPFDHPVGLVAVEGAAGQIGLLGVGTGGEVQLDGVEAAAFSPVNLEDFPAAVAESLSAQLPGLTVRRAFRYADSTLTASLKASPVEADVRVEAQQTLSLGEDRTVLAATLNVTIARAGIFRLSFLMPEGYDVEAISGAALSHWTEARSEAGRVITLNLKGRTEGAQQFSVSLAGPGARTTERWSAPGLLLREADKQQGTLVIVPEQGMQLQALASEGLSQLDPARSDIRQKGVLAFRILQTDWSLALVITQVDAWVQVTGLQHATVNEALVKVAANFQYKIENTGLKALHVHVPTNAESVNFSGEDVGDFLPVPGAVTNGLQRWEVKLRRRVIGPLALHATYQTFLPAGAPQATLRGMLAADVNLQRGFVTVQPGGRLQLRVDETPASLQPAEWQAIPRALQQNLPATAASLTYRLVDPAFELPLRLERHDAAKLLPARVSRATLTSVISDDGVMLTQTRLDMLTGDMRLLNFSLPEGAEFWFAFVNQGGVWPWREDGRILIPLDQQSRDGQTVPVEIFYTSRVGRGGARDLDLRLAAPKFDLPLEDITWRVFLSGKWEVKRWDGAMQMQQEELARGGLFDVQSYLRSEAEWQRGKSQEAEQMLSFGNSLLEKGDPQQARRAFQQAYGLSQGDMAFNEDARVQLNNLRLQQALVGLNVRQEAVAGEGGAVAGKLRELRERAGNRYSQGDARAIIDRNPAELNGAYMRLAQRLIQQQDAAVASPMAIRANLPEQGRVLTFRRAVLVDTWADLGLTIEARSSQAASWGRRLWMLAGTFAGFALLGAAIRRLAPREA